MKAEFTILGEPKGKGRPRFSKSGNAVRTYTPKETAEYENQVKAEYIRQCGGVEFDKGVMLEMSIYAYFKIPKSASRIKHQQMLKEIVRPTKKPDMDNIIKIIADSLNGIAYYDDSQIVKVTAEKYYSDAPRVEVNLKEI